MEASRTRNDQTGAQNFAVAAKEISTKSREVIAQTAKESTTVQKYKEGPYSIAQGLRKMAGKVQKADYTEKSQTIAFRYS